MATSTYTVQTAQTDLLAVTHGLTINQISNINGLFNRAARQLLFDVDPIETKRYVLTATPLYDKVNQYACPIDVKGNGIIDISPQGQNRYPNQVIQQEFNQDFSANKSMRPNTSGYSIKWNSQIKTILINDASLPYPVTMDSMNQVGNWKIGSNVTAISENNVNFVTGSGSLQLNTTSGSNPLACTVYEALPSSINLATAYNQSSFFMYAYFPVASNIVSVTLNVGTDVNDYYSMNVSITNEGTSFATAWNLLRFDWLGATVFGSPNPANLNYLSVTVNTNGTATTGILLDNITNNMGLYRTIEYYSKYLFTNASTGAFQETTTNTSDIINLDTDTYNLFFNILAYLTCQQVQGLSAAFFDANFFLTQYTQAKARYQQLNPSERNKPHASYYTKRSGSMYRWIGRGFRN